MIEGFVSLCGEEQRGPKALNMVGEMGEDMKLVLFSQKPRTEGGRKVNGPLYDIAELLL